MTHFGIIIGLLVGILTVLTSLGVGLRWIYHQGAASEELKHAVQQNTGATEELTNSYKVFTIKIQDTMMDHEKRLTRLETTTELQRSRSASDGTSR
jgi:hypothetical protein